MKLTLSEKPEIKNILESLDEKKINTMRFKIFRKIFH